MKLKFDYGLTGKTLYAILIAEDDTVHDNVSGLLDSYLLADWGDYDVPLTETDIPGVYGATVTVSGWPHKAQNFVGSIFEQSGGSPSRADDTRVGSLDLPFNGVDLAIVANTQLRTPFHIMDDVSVDGNGYPTDGTIYWYETSADLTTHDKVTGVKLKTTFADAVWTAGGALTTAPKYSDVRP